MSFCLNSVIKLLENVISEINSMLLLKISKLFFNPMPCETEFYMGSAMNNFCILPLPPTSDNDENQKVLEIIYVLVLSFHAEDI